MPDTFPAGWVGGWLGGWVVGWGQVDIKDHLSPAKLELGLSLAIFYLSDEKLSRWKYFIIWMIFIIVLKVMNFVILKSMIFNKMIFYHSDESITKLKIHHLDEDTWSRLIFITKKNSSKRWTLLTKWNIINKRKSLLFHWIQSIISEIYVKDLEK